MWGSLFWPGSTLQIYNWVAGIHNMELLAALLSKTDTSTSRNGPSSNLQKGNGLRSAVQRTGW